MKKIYLGNAFRILAILLLLPLAGRAQTYINTTSVYKIVNRATGRALEIGGNDRLAQYHSVNLWDYWGGANQQWTFAYGYLSGTYEIRNRHSQQYLEIAAGRYYGNLSTPSGSIATQNYHQSIGAAPGDPVQLWNVEPVATGGVRIHSVGGGLYLAGTSNNDVFQDYSSTSTQQLWDIVDMSANYYQQAELGVYSIVNVRSGKVLSAGDLDINVVQRTNYDYAIQQWTFGSLNSDGYRAIINRTDGQVLEIGGNNDPTTPGLRANVWSGYGGTRQQWALRDANNGDFLTLAQASDGRRVVLQVRSSGGFLEIGGATNLTWNDGQPANQWGYYGNDNQMWYVRYISANRNSGSVGALAVKEQAANEQHMNLAPNPAHDLITVTLAGEVAPVAVKITDIRGASTSARYLSNGKVDVTALAPGVYVVTASDGKREYHQKLVKE